VLAEGWKPRFGSTALAGVLMIGWATGIAWFDVIEAEHDYLGLAIWAVITAPGAWWCWTRRRRSLVTAFGLSSIGLLTTVLCRLLSWDDISDALLVGLAVLGQITVLVQLVRRLKEPQ
jgi:hypothetical protein